MEPFLQPGEVSAVRPQGSKAAAVASGWMRGIALKLRLTTLTSHADNVSPDCDFFSTNTNLQSSTSGICLLSMISVHLSLAYIQLGRVLFSD